MKITLFNASVVCALCAMSGYASAAPSLRMTGGTPATATAPAGVGVSRGGSLRIGGMTGARSAVGTTAKTVSVSNGSKNMTVSSSQRMPSVTSFIGTTKLGHNLNNGGTSVPAGDILSRMDALERDIDDLARQLDTSSAREIEMGMDDGYISWRHVGDTTWQHLIQIPDGDDATGGMGGFYRLALADVEWAKENCMRAYDTSTYVGLFSLQDLDNVTETQYANALDGFLRTVEWMPCSGAESSTAANNLMQQLRTDTSFYDQVNHLAQLRAVVTNYTEPPVEPTVYTIAYNLNGGQESTGVFVTSYTAGQTTLVRAKPVRDYYTFDGWCLNGTSMCSTNEYFTIDNTQTGDITLVAHWTPNTYAIAYYNTTGTTWTTGNHPDEYTYGQTVSVTAGLTKSGYNFSGWCDDSDCTQNCNATRTISASMITPTTAKVQLYACFTEVSKKTLSELKADAHDLYEYMNTNTNNCSWAIEEGSSTIELSSWLDSLRTSSISVTDVDGLEQYIRDFIAAVLSNAPEDSCSTQKTYIRNNYNYYI